MDFTKVKLLNNYQLHQLAQNRSLDKDTLKKVHQELQVRNISTLEQKKLEARYQETFVKTNETLDANAWNPFYTAFAWKRHFKQVALLKALKRYKEAKVYQIRFYVGMLVYMLLFILIILVFRK